MTESQRYADLARRAHEGDAWHGPSLREALEGVDARAAAARPIAEAHSIWEIALHIAAWDGVVARRLREEFVSEPEEGDWPAVNDTSPEAWRGALTLVDERGRAFASAVAALEQSDLADSEADKPSARFTSAHGQIQHKLYHAGQIALLRKALA